MNYSHGNFDILIFIYVCFMSVKIVCLRDIILSQQGVNIQGSNFKYFCTVNKKMEIEIFSNDFLYFFL